MKPHWFKRLLGARGASCVVRFREGQRTYECLVPDESLWYAVKDVLLLTDYEREGIALGNVTGTVVDAGANVGLFTVRAARYAARVVALEPDSRNLELLHANVSANGLTNVEVRAEALWPWHENVTLVRDGRSTATSVSASGTLADDAVETATLDGLVDGLGAITLLKLDIEGAEFDVIRSATHAALQRIDVVVAEIHLGDEPSRLDDVVRHLETAGFAVVVREAPVRYWRESMTTLLRRWRATDDLRRLKLAVMLGYTGFAAASAILRRPVADDHLRFIYATRTS